MKSKTLALPLILLIVLSATGAASDTIRVSYEFDKPKVTIGARGHEVAIEGLLSTARPGEPMLPVHTARILLPHGQTVAGFTVEVRQQLVLPERVTLAHAPPVQPIGLPPSSADKREERIYSSAKPYPEKALGRPSEQHLRGHTFLVVNLYPVQYVPSEGKLLFSPALEVAVETKKATDAKKVVRTLYGRLAADNPSALSTYPAIETSRGSAEYLLITSAELLPHFEPLLEWKRLKGVTCKSALVEEITDGIGTDLQAKVRDYIRECYQTEGTEYVLLGGDDGIIPARGVYGEVGLYLDEHMPCDLYYAALDGTWDGNGNRIFGEPDDGPANGEVDLLAEVLVGRAPVDTPEEAQNFVRKVLAYEQGNVPNISTCVWVGEQLDNITYGSDSKESVLSLMPDGYSHVRLYDETNTFSRQRVLDALNASPHAVNHLGHSSESFALGLEKSDLELVNNDSPFFVYSQGCYAGAFDTSTSGEADCIGEKFVTMANGAYAGVFNSRYGWYSPGTATAGPSHFFDREFFDTVFIKGTSDPQLAKLGAAHQRSKESLLGRLNEQAMRWCYMNLNLFGDPETTLYNVLSKGTISLSARVYQSTAKPRIAVTDYDLNVSHVAVDTVEILAWSDSEPHPKPLVLTETCANSGVFVGQVGLTSEATLPGQLQVWHGDEITVLYLDADDGSGMSREVSTTALVDDVPPTISDVRIEDIRDTSAVVSWKTDEPAISRVEFGGTELDRVAEDADLKTLHALRMSNLSPDSVYGYAIVSIDEAGNAARISTVDMHFQTKWATDVFFDDIEPGGPAAKAMWYMEVLTGRSSAWQRTQLDSSSKRYSWHADDFHSPSAVVLDTPTIDLAGVSSAQLVFRHRMLSERNYDGGFVQVSRDGGFSWHTLPENKMIEGTPYDRLGATCPSPEVPAWTGNIPWETVIFDLSDYGNRTIKVRFRMESDSAVDAGDNDGWYVDDVAVTSVHGMIALDRVAYRPGDVVRLTVFDGKANALRGGGKASSLFLRSLAEPLGEPVRPVHIVSGNVVGEARLDPGPPMPDGLVQVDSLDSITARYYDGKQVHEATSRVDDIPPVIRNVRVLDATADSATIAWDTDEPTDARVFYGMSERTDLEAYRPSFETSHFVRVHDLERTTRYFFRLLCTDAAGNTTLDDNGGQLFTMVSGGFELSGSISEDTTLAAIPGYPWKVVADLRVEEGVTLTIEPGTVLKFWNGERGLNNASLWVYGSLQAVGTSEQPIVFTSMKDDSIWGDTNGDGDATQPEWGDWGTVLFGASSGESRVLEHCILKYGGWDGGQLCGAVESRDPTGIVRDCRFEQNGFPIAMFLGGQPKLSNVELEGNRFNGVWLRPGSFAGASTLDLVGIPYILWSSDGRDLTIPSVGQLTVGPGVVVKAGGNAEDTRRASLAVEGTIRVVGTEAQPVVFTSLSDDSVLGDTNSDGSATSPAVGDWGRVLLNGADAEMEHCAVRYAGMDGTDHPALECSYGSLALRYCEISASSAGLRAGYHSTVSVSNCTIAMNADYGLTFDAASTGLVKNSIIAFNGGGGMAQDLSSSLVSSYCDSYGNSGGDWLGATPGEGCFSLDPLFRRVDLLDLRLTDASPCIDAGIPDETDPGTSSRVDLGAYPWRELE